MPIINISLFSNDEMKSSSGKTVSFDGIFSATPNNTNTVTTRPTEDGFDANDAVHNNAKTVDIEIIVTDTAQSLLDTRAFTSLANIAGFKLIKSYTKKQLNILQKISDDKETVTIKTKYDKYEGYFLTNFSYTETDDDALIISFSIIENRIPKAGDTLSLSDAVGVFS